MSVNPKTRNDNTDLTSDKANSNFPVCKKLLSLQSICGQKSCMCREVLTTVMRKHQRYFPVLDAAGHLLPHFVTVANGFINTAQVPTTQLPVFDNCPSAPHSSLCAAAVIMAACAHAASGSSWSWPGGRCC